MTDDHLGATPARLTSQEHWDAAWNSPPRWRLPSPFVVSTLNLQRLLRRHVRSGMRVLELGCAPGKTLAWAAAVLGASVSGADYSKPGVNWARQLFGRLGLPGDIRCEDAFTSSFEPGSFDLVYSAGLIEHFDDPRDIVRTHVTLARPGGLALIAVPNYGGIYGRLQGWFDPRNLAVHNLEIMSIASLARLAPADLAADVRAYRWGRVSPWQVHLAARWPRPLANAVSYALNGLGLLQPLDIGPLCPMLVVEITRRGTVAC